MDTTITHSRNFPLSFSLLEQRFDSLNCAKTVPFTATALLGLEQLIAAK